jgi:type IV fimbrial biogenesis protein FimT
MVVIAIVGVLSAIALPNLLRSLPEKRVKNAARNLYADLQKARLLAVKENKKNFPVRFNTADNSYYFDANNDSAHSSGEFKRAVTEDGNDVRYGCGAVTDWNGVAAPSSGVTGSDASGKGAIIFTNTGTAATDGVAAGTEGIIFLSGSAADVCYAVGVSNFGAVKIKRQEGGGTSPWK